MEKLLSQWIDDALNARDHNVSVPALVEKVLTTCHRTGGDAAVVGDECAACRSFRTEKAEKAYQEQSAAFAQTQVDLRGTEKNLKDEEDATAVIQRQLLATQVELEAIRAVYFKTATNLAGMNDVAERRAVEVNQLKDQLNESLISIVGLKDKLGLEQVEVARLTDLANQMVK